LPDGYGDPVESDRPVLLLSGFLDPVTPPRWGAIVGQSLSNATEIVVPGVGHGTLFYGCVPDLMAEFIEQGSAEGLDISCVDSIKRPRFFDFAQEPVKLSGNLP
jgi:hypothetical protein